MGNGVDPDTQIGPLVSEQQFERVTSYLNVARQEGARAAVGGQQLTEGPFAKGYFVAPTVYADVRDDMRIAQEEIFGAVISAIPFTDLDEVIRGGNATTFGLGSGVWTRDVSKAHRLAKGLRAGSVWINCYTGDGSGHPIRRLQDERLRPRIRHPADGRVFECEGGVDQNRVGR